MVLFYSRISNSFSPLNTILPTVFCDSVKMLNYNSRLCLYRQNFFYEQLSIRFNFIYTYLNVLALPLEPVKMLD